MAGHQGDLRSAHEGYRYQDIATGFALVESVVYRYIAVTVDRKDVANDHFDDLSVETSERRIRRQYKSSRNRDKRLTQGRFTLKRSELRFDKLIRSYTGAGANPADEYRLCATWRVPDEQPLLDLLEDSDAPPSIPGWNSQRFRIRGERLWPSGGQPLWNCIAGAALTREDMLDFCARFVIELELPVSSRSLANPGPLENARIELLRDRVGIGLYPNHQRSPIDVAALAVGLGNLARTQAARLTPTDVERELGIRTDFGRVSQAFPVDPVLAQERPTVRRDLVQAGLRGESRIVTGPPGAGKSWELTGVADELAQAGALVARHYCYLEPGDTNVERRITIDILFGNLMAELADADPALRDVPRRRYVAGLDELEEILGAAATMDRPVVLIVDGLDHIARVRAEARGVRDEDTDIVEQLATIALPAGVALLVGPQLGEHLNPLRERFGDDAERIIPPWSVDEVTALAQRRGVVEALAAIGVHECTPVLSLLAERSEGNPLYATYLAEELRGGLVRGEIMEPMEWLEGAPVIGGEIAVYYAHLYRRASETAQAIADILAMIDFAVSEAELREIMPAPLRGWVAEGLRTLMPVLTAVSGQGGVRIYHESFRRFMVAELARRGRSVADALEPVIGWLEGRGFYQDAKAFRFLLPALRRAQRANDALRRIGVDFASQSLAHGHPRAAAERNLAVGLDMAAESLRWPDLVRLVELHRSLHTAYEEKLAEPLAYWEAYMDLRGPGALAERMLFDGRPTLPRGLGLVLCSRADDAGATPPWHEYLALPLPAGRARTYDREAERRWNERVNLSDVHGSFRVDGLPRTAQRLFAFLLERGGEADPHYLHLLAERIRRSGGMQLLKAMVDRGGDPPAGKRPLAPPVLATLRLVLAKAYRDEGEVDAAAGEATIAVRDIGMAALALECVRLDAPRADARALAVPLDDLAARVAGGELHPEKADVRTWVTSVRLLAGIDEAALDAELARLQGMGWYRCWLRFVIGMARAEAAEPGIREELACAAFTELSRDVHPFKGRPRACDLFSIRDVITESLTWGFSLLQTDVAWEIALRHVRRAMHGTAVSLQGDSSGPLTTEAVLEALLPYSALAEISPQIRAFAEQEVARGEAVGTYLETHAERSMALVRILSRGETAAAAEDVWQHVGRYLAGYGYRKDTTVFEIIESATVLERAGAIAALTATQPLTRAVVRHTDGSETRHAPNAWLRSLLHVHPVAGVEVLVRSISGREAHEGWRVARAMADALEVAAGKGADPRLVSDLYATLPFRPEFDNDGEERADVELRVIEELMAADHEAGLVALRRLAAQVSDDGQGYNAPAKTKVQEFAGSRAAAAVRLRDLAGANESNSRIAQEPIPGTRAGILRAPRPLLFPAAATALDRVAGIRKAEAQRHELSREGWDGFVSAFGYRLLELVEGGAEDEVVRLLRLFARQLWISSDEEHPLIGLAEGLERHGCRRAAAVAYALAFAKSRGSLGWYSIGDQTHESLLLRGVELDRGAALATLAGEIAYMLRGAYGNHGVTRAVIERAAAWGEPEVARACWWEACAVIRHRLPLSVEGSAGFERFDPEALLDWSLDEALCSLLIARMDHPYLSRKVSAVAGLVHALLRRPADIVRPVEAALRREMPLTSTLLVLAAIALAEPEPFQLTHALSGLLAEFARNEPWGMRMLARELLRRAGIPVSDATWDAPTAGRSAIPATEISRDLQLDHGERIPRLAEVWAGLPVAVARRLREIVSGPAHEEEGKRRYRLAHGDHGDASPQTPTLLWETELFEAALHDALNGVRTHLWATGEWAPGAEAALLPDVLPDLRIHLGLNASRVPRPAYPFPAKMQAGSGPVMVLGDEEPRFAGWLRIGYVERQWFRKDPNRSKSTMRQITVHAGAIAAFGLVKPPPGAIPMKAADVSEWWSGTEGDPPIPPSGIGGLLVGFDVVSDWLGFEGVLIPPAEALAGVPLTAPAVGEPLAWRDENGVPAIALRVWQVRSSEYGDAEPLACRGLDLLIRPDMYTRVCSAAAAPVREVRVVESEETKAIRVA